MNVSGSRRCFIHVGTHKTGTTWLQDTLARNADGLATTGTLVPRAGRAQSRFGTHIVGHHNIGYELLSDPAFEPADGSLADLQHELASSACTRAVISSEALSFAHHVPAALDRLSAAVTAAGFEPVIVIYLRGQASFARSLYTMFVITHKSAVDFASFCDHILAHGGLSGGDRFVSFAYDRLLDAFEHVFGREHIVVRPFVADPDPTTILRDFLRVLDADSSTDAAQLTTAPHLNRGGSLGDVMTALYANTTAVGSHLVSPERVARELGISQAALDMPFDPRDETVSLRFDGVFAEANRAIRDRYGIEIVHDATPSARATEQLAFVKACNSMWRHAA